MSEIVDFEEEIMGILSSIESKIDGTPIPLKLKSIIEIKLDAIETSEKRVEDSIGTHLSWGFYHNKMFGNERIMNGPLWEVLYKELEIMYPQWSVSHFHALNITVDVDPMKMSIRTCGLKPMFVDGKTTPEYIALAHEMGYNLHQLKQPLIAFSIEDLPEIDAMIKHIFGHEHDLFTLINAHTHGFDVVLS